MAIQPVQQSDLERYRSYRRLLGLDHLLHKFVFGFRDTRSNEADVVIANLAAEQIRRIRKRRSPDDCDHSKGQQGPQTHKDYALSDHTFIDGSRRIKCTVCGREWRPGQPHWAEALEMMRHSTNTPTSTEQPNMYRDENGTWWGKLIWKTNRR